MSSKIGIVVPVLNNFKGFTELVESIKSRHETKLYIQPQHRAQVPLAAAWNKGFRDAVADGCDYIAILNDDILLSPQTLDRMIVSFDLLPKDVVLVSANNINGQVATPHEIFNHSEQDVADMTYSDHPNYSCFMVKKDFFDKVGSFDENFVPAWYEDNDSHKRILELGFRAVCTTYASCIHYGGVTTSMMESPDSGVSQAYYVRKWGGLPYSHPVPEDMKERFKHPYNDSNLSPKEWELGR